jgi:diguanylate cyclase (GGDEF)-like protein
MPHATIHRQLHVLSEKKRPVMRLVIAAMTLVLVLVTAMTVMQLWTYRTNRLADASTSTSNIARVLSLHAEMTLRVADLVLEDMVERAEKDGLHLGATERLSHHLQHISEKATELHGLFVYDRHGKWLSTSLGRVIQQNNSDREYFKYHQKNSDRTTHISAPIRSRSTGEWIIPVSRRLENQDGSFAGVALATMKLDFFEKAYNKLDVGAKGTVLLALDDGTLYYRRPFTDSIVGTNISNGPLMQYYKLNGPAATAELTAKFDGVKRLYSYRHLDGFPVIVAAGLSADEVYEGWWNNALQMMGALLFFVATLLWLGKRLLRQLAVRERLEEQLRVVSDGLSNANTELSALAMKDGLTQLANRRAFDIAADLQFGQQKRDRTPISLLMFDVDHFKKFNDTYGHPAGDSCLQKIASASASQITRQTDLLARYGGEEFVVLLPATDLAGAIGVAERIRQAVAEQNIAHELTSHGSVTVSIGVATVVPSEQPSSAPADLLSAADIALYESKNTGRNKVSSKILPTVEM